MNIKPVRQEYVDVAVCGGGWSGCLAAIASARTGAKTLLIEEKSMLGGVASSSFMNSMTNFFNTGDDCQVIRGIPDEIMEESVRRGFVSADFRLNEYRQIPYDLEGFHQVVLDKLQEAGVRLWSHAAVIGADAEDGTLKSLYVKTRGGIHEVFAKTVVDATGDLSVVHDCDPEAAINEKVYSSTLLFEVSNVNLDETLQYFIDHPENYDEKADVRISFEGFQRNWKERGMFHLPHYGGHAIRPLQEAIENGDYARRQGLAVDCDAFAIFAYRPTGKVLINSNFYEINELDDPETFSRAELNGRKICMTLFGVLKKYFPGFQNAQMAQMGTALGSRRVRYLNGEETMIDLLQPYRYDDVIGVVPLVDFSQENGFFGLTGVEIPFRTLFTKKLKNVINGSAKSMSGTWAARHYVRLQPICMLLGHAAGTAAALMARDGVSAAELDVAKLQKELLSQKAYLGTDDRIRELGLDAPDNGRG